MEQREQEQARRYAQHVAPTLVNVARRAVDLAGVESGNSVLDVGTATGLAAFLAAERAGRDGSIIGLDTSEALLEVARERSASVGYDYIHWRTGAAAPLDFADESFDAVLCVQALHEVENPFAALEEFRRVLVEEGRAVLTLWSSKTSNEWLMLLEQAMRRALPSSRALPVPTLSQPGNVEALMQAAGFQEIEVARAQDRMRFPGADGLWEWALSWRPWAAALGSLSEAQAERARAALADLLAPRVRDGEVAVGRELVYLRAVAPEAA
jgi:ubiquinone/menaquinone biosynthesis C-methylase UbiE